MSEQEYEEEQGNQSRTTGRSQTNEAVLPRGEYMYTRDTTSGVTSVRCGPTVVNKQAQDEPVTFNEITSRFDKGDLRSASQVYTVVPTGHYAVMLNPRADRKFPEPGTKSADSELLIGQRDHIAGPASFALWPRQVAKVIEGHQLRSNQYLLVRVYDEKAARNNWTDAVMKKAAAAAAASTTTTEDGAVGESVALTASAGVPEDLSVGRLLVIRGTEVSFYIPPTGIEVLPGESGKYVREALTLERLQYCILVDESGNKRYVRGPNVVFPFPTETFFLNNTKSNTFRPVELNGEIQGIHIKVIAEYVDKNGDHGKKGTKYNEGDELFITGKTTPIYFPCEQHSAIKYDGKTKHYATAIPAGDGRYLLDRHTGVIRVASGGESGRMVLPDPRTEVFVRRVLTDAECEAMYPGNVEVATYNNTLRNIQTRSPSTRKGVVSEGDLRHNLAKAEGKKSRRSERGGTTRTALEHVSLQSSDALNLNIGDAAFADITYSNALANAEMGGDEFTRAATYTEPRMVTLGNDKFAGVPKINPWTGYSVMVVDTAGNRRVEHGPKRVLLEFNETLETLALSTGKPKTTQRLQKTAYLQINHNKVTDIFTVDTSDHVTIAIKVALRVDFEPTKTNPTDWFSVSNYVKLLTDHVRSVVKGKVRKASIEDFWGSSEDFIRDAILGAKPEDGGSRTGMIFDENGMRIYDVEVLDVQIGDVAIQDLLTSVQHEAVESNIQLARDARRLEATCRQQELSREEMRAKAETTEYQSQLTIDKIALDLGVAMSRIKATIDRSDGELEEQNRQDTIDTARTDAEIARDRARADSALDIFTAKEDVRLNALQKEADTSVQQLTALSPGFSEALLALGNQETLKKVAEAMSVQQFIGGKDLVEVVEKVFKGTPLADLSTLMLERAAGAPFSKPNGTTRKKGSRALPAE